MLYCEECGCCSGELGKAFVCDDPDDHDPPAIVLYCPPCATSEFGYRPDLAETYVCAWEPLPGQVIDGP